MVSFDHMDMDGYALRWGSDHIASSLADCGRRRHGEIWEIWTSSLATAAGGDMGRYGEIWEIWTSSLADCGSRASLLTRNYY